MGEPGAIKSLVRSVKHAKPGLLAGLLVLAGCTLPPVQPSSSVSVQSGDPTLLSAYPSAASLTPADLSNSNAYHITITSNLWERLSSDFSLQDGKLPFSFEQAQPLDDEREIWERLRSGFALPDRQHPQARQHGQAFADDADHLEYVVDQARPYLYYILNEIQKRDMPTEIALLPVIESAYQPLARSPSGASGIWQFIPSTGRNFGLKETFWYDGRRDIIASTDAALTYLQRLNVQYFDGDWLLSLAAYNCGEGTVLRAMKKNIAAGKPTDFWSLDLPVETERYVPKLLGVAAMVDHPEDFGAELGSIPDKPHLSAVKMDAQIDLEVAARLADITPHEISVLNPGFINGATDPEGVHQLLLPANKVALFNSKLASLEFSNLMPPNSKRSKQQAKKELAKKSSSKKKTLAKGRTAIVDEGKTVSYKVRKGDTLGSIAKRFKVSLAQLKKWNGGKLQAKKLKPGNSIKIFAGAS